ncbi:MAG: phosphoribosylamine--glycine ligase, partial [Spirochaetaceae bacterium]|nr:phosphoribosylamine--glycine ligase [Spirochaetaceae bacterium]
MKILVVGSGGREHAISWRLAKSGQVDEVICVPGNGGTINETKCRNINPEDCDYAQGLAGNDAVAQVASFEQVDFAVIGPEDPLCAGI